MDENHGWKNEITAIRHQIGEDEIKRRGANVSAQELIQIDAKTLMNQRKIEDLNACIQKNEHAKAQLKSLTETLREEHFSFEVVTRLFKGAIQLPNPTQFELAKEIQNIPSANGLANLVLGRQLSQNELYFNELNVLKRYLTLITHPGVLKKTEQLIEQVEHLKKTENQFTYELINILKNTRYLLLGHVLPQNYETLAHKAKSYQSDEMKMLGTFMSRLGAVMAIVGIVIATTGIGLVPGIAIAATGLGITLACQGIFGSTKLSKAMSELKKVNELDHEEVPKPGIK
ncbi:MAG: hypothetical protein PSV35_04870 [bacterium]|nr:hypothetical protein [bacterium]